MAEATYISKMSIKTLGCKPKLAAVLDEGDKTVIALARFFGRADGLATGEMPNGDVWTALKGSFEGVNLETGEVFKSGKLFLPGGIQEVVENAVITLENAKAAEGSTVGADITIKFALEVGAVRASNPQGYSYQAVNLIPAEADDELSSMRKAIAGVPVKGVSAGKQLPPAPAAPAQLPAPSRPPDEAPKPQAAAPKRR